MLLYNKAVKLYFLGLMEKRGNELDFDKASSGYISLVSSATLHFRTCKRFLHFIRNHLYGHSIQHFIKIYPYLLALLVSHRKREKTNNVLTFAHLEAYNGKIIS